MVYIYENIFVASLIMHFLSSMSIYHKSVLLMTASDRYIDVLLFQTVIYLDARPL